MIHIKGEARYRYITEDESLPVSQKRATSERPSDRSRAESRPQSKSNPTLICESKSNYDRLLLLRELLHGNIEIPHIHRPYHFRTVEGPGVAQPHKTFQFIPLFLETHCFLEKQSHPNNSPRMAGEVVLHGIGGLILIILTVLQRFWADGMHY
jgi:hypothetical protein